ncbi:MAG: hypothetical protein LH478_16270 [Chitinophagaceae bacterium]|nr:hypothetical protein [Chitinophagaceae bacterium]
MKTLLLFVALLPIALFAQVTRQPLTVRYTSFGAYSKNFVDIFSGSSNQAALAQLKTGGFGVYGERRFMLDDLNQYSGIFAVPTSSGTFALQADYFGFSGMNENQLGLAYGRLISSRLDVGVKFNYHSIKIAGYGNAAAINFEAGTIFHLTEQLHAGFHIYNPFSSSFSKNNAEKLPAIFKTGLGYEASDKVFISTEIIKQEDEPVNVNVGLQYNLQEKVLLRTGISTANTSSFAGVGIYLGNIRLDVNASYHPQLGFTPGILLLYNFKKPSVN